MGLTRTRFIQANTALAKIQDPITVLNSEATIANVDVGFIINRNQGTKSNVALFWNESSSEFVTAFSANTGALDSNITITNYANVRANTIFANIGGASDISNVYITGSILPSANISFDLGSTDNRFKTLWLSGNTIVMGKESLTVNENGEWIFTVGANTVTIGSLYNFVGDNATTGNLTVTGNLSVTGNTFIINSTNTSLVDSIIDLHTQSNLVPLTSDDGRDIGFKFHYYKTQDEHAFLGWSNDSGYLEWYDSGREGVGNVFTGNTYGTIKSGGLLLANTTSSTNTTTGALQVAGGVGIAGNLYVNNVGDVSANIGTIKTSINTVNANIGSYQLYANANAAGQQTTIDTLLSNAAAQHTAIYSLDANVGSYQTFANANAGVQSTDIASIVSGANSNVAAYLITNTGNVAAGNLIVSGNIYGGIVPSAIYKDFYLGTSTVNLARSSGTLTVDDFNTTGYAAQANLSTLATNATKTTVTSNISSGTAYVSFVSATTGNVDQNVNTGLTYDPNSGNLRAYGLLTDTGVYWAGNNSPYGGSDDVLRANVGAYQTYANANVVVIQANLGAYQTYANANIGTLFLGNASTNANLGAYQSFANTSIVSLFTNANANTAAYLTTYTGNIQAGNINVTGNITAESNVFANIFYVSNSIRWAGNGAVFASGGGGSGGTLTASNTAPVSPSASDFWYYIAGDILFQYINDGDSSQWVDISSPVAPTSTVVSDLILSNVTISSVYNVNNTKTALGVLPTVAATPPGTPIRGDLWYNTSEDILYQYTFDGTSNYWVDISSADFGFTNNSTSLLDTTITGNLVPSANITYSLGTTSQRFKDLFLSGNTIDLGGATIKTDASSGAIALIPQPTVANPNPTGIVVSPAGTISTVATTGGNVTANAIGSSSNSASTSNTTTFGNIVANGNVTANRLTTTTGLFWANGTAFSSGGTNAATVNALGWAQKIFWG